MEWTIEQLDKLDKDISKLYLNSEMSAQSLADVMGKIDTKRFEINQANGVVIKRCFCGGVWDGITCNHCGFNASEIDIY